MKNPNGGLVEVLKHVQGDYALRYAFTWNFIWQTATLFCFYLLYREWKKLGGRDGFKPPPVRPAAAAGDEAE